MIIHTKDTPAPLNLKHKSLLINPAKIWIVESWKQKPIQLNLGLWWQWLYEETHAKGILYSEFSQNSGKLGHNTLFRTFLKLTLWGSPPFTNQIRKVIFERLPITLLQ